jgi:hypothetical protein
MAEQGWIEWAGDAVNDAAERAFWQVADPFGVTQAAFPDQVNSFNEFMSGSATETLSGVTNDNTLAQRKYNFRYMAFPNDLGMDYAGHYMVININVPIELDSARAGGPARMATDIPGAQSRWEFLENEMSKVDVLRFNASRAATGTTASDSYTTRRTRRIAESIALYMPGSQLVYRTVNELEEISMTALGGKIAAAAVGAAIAAASAGTATAAAAGYTAMGYMAGFANPLQTGAKLAGRPINPRIEVLWSKVDLRTFQFEFLMMPRNAEEAKTIEQIIYTLRYHAAPELEADGWLWIPPAEFDITFFNRGVETDKIPRINTCALTQIDVDYAPGMEMWATHADGYPVAVRLMLVFRELEPLHKLRIAQGF